MQSAYSLSSEVIEQDKIEKLSLRLSRWRLLAFIFVGFAFVLAIGLVFAINSKNQPYVQQDSFFTSKQTPYASQSCTNFLFNETNLTEFTWRIGYNTSRKSQSSLDQTTKIKSLNVSYNFLKKFCDNSLPDLEQLKLFSYKVFTNYYYDNISNNNFPKLQNLTIPAVNTFSNNYLPSLINFQQYNFFYLDYFDNNYMPTLNGSRDFQSTKSITGNTLGLQGLRYDVKSDFQFKNNTFLELKQLSIYCWSQNHPMPATHVTNNYLPKLQNLCIACNIQDFNSSKKFSKLKKLDLSSGSIKSFNNNVYPELTWFYIIAENLKTFTNNQLPLLEKLHVESNELTNFCQGNHMPKLKSVELSLLGNLKGIDCLKESQQLENLRIDIITAPIENFNLPKLKSLFVSVSPRSNVKFSNNSFPIIVNATFLDMNSFTSFQKDKITFGNTLENLGVHNSNLQELSFSTVMPKLAKLYITESQLTSVNCTTFRNIKELVLSQNSLKDDVIDTLIDCNFTNPSYIYLQQNQISDKVKGRAKLSSKYPNCYISL